MFRTLCPITVVAAALLLAACSSTPLDETPPIVDKSTTAADAASSAGAASTAVPDPGADAVTPVTAGARDELNDPDSPLAKRSIYFDFDSFIVKPEFQVPVEAHARYLNADRARRAIVEGNADERGSREYNLALGQKRADAVRNRLTLLGVSEQQVETISLVEEKPRALEHDEAAWAENRRADIVYGK